MRPGATACERCEQPVEGPATVRYNPAGLALPSPIQGHATVLAGVVGGVALLAFAAWFMLHGVGPFQSTVVGEQVLPGRPAVVAQVRVTNDGSRTGKARCQVSGTSTDGLRYSSVGLSPDVAPHRSATFRLRVEGLNRTSDLTATCN